MLECLIQGEVSHKRISFKQNYCKIKDYGAEGVCGKLGKRGSKSFVGVDYLRESRGELFNKEIV